MKKIMFLGILFFSLFAILLLSEEASAQCGCGSGISCTGTCVSIPLIGDVCGYCEAEEGESCGGSPMKYCEQQTQCISGKCKSEGSSGTSCGTNSDCNSGLYCDLFTCKNKKGIGGLCSANWVCQSGLECIALTCQDPGVEGSTCGTNSDCNSGLYCDLFTCTAKKGEGGSCSANWVCQSGLECLFFTCQSRGDAGDSCIGIGQGTCKTDLECDGSTSKCAHSPREKGEGCGTADPCKTNLYCSNPITGTCYDRKEAGESCHLINNFLGPECKSGLECDGSTSKCAHSPREKGEGCGTADPCKTNLYCSNPITGTCYDRKEAGESCHLINNFLGPECKSGLECDGSTSKCAHSPREKGEGCGIIDPCASDYYCTNPVAGICEDRLKAGDECATQAECADGLDCRLTSEFKNMCFPQEGHELFDRDTCLAFHSSGVHQNVKDMNTAQTFGFGSAGAVGIGASDQVGVIYGPDGRFGCFFTTCIGGETNAGIKDFVATGFYNSYNVVRGTSIVFVEEAGEILTFSTSQIVDQNWVYIGTEDALAIGVSILPVSAGTYQCNTVIDTFMGDLNGVPTAIPLTSYPNGTQIELSAEMADFLASFNEAPVAICNDVNACYDSSTCMAIVADIDGGSYDPDGDSLIIIQNSTGPFSSGSYNVSLLVTDDLGASDNCTALVTIQDCETPSITCPGDVTTECESYSGTVVFLEASATDICESEPIITGDNLDIYPLGQTTVTFTAEDEAENTASCTTIVTVEDTIPPVIESVIAVPNKLWPPNHKMNNIVVEAVTSDICGSAVSCEIIDVVSNEADFDAEYKDDKPNDILITGQNSVDLRAERIDDGDGRIYSLTVECSDDLGNKIQDTTTVNVPHDSRKDSKK